MLALTIFIICAGMLIYIYLAFPLGVIIAGSLKHRTFQPRWMELPKVTMIFAAFNEASVILQKLKNALTQDYPEDKLDIVVVDDRSEDGTPQLVEEFNSPRITLIRQEQRRGKTAALNRAALAARGEVLVFTDANSMYQPDAVRHLIGAFDREGQIGIVNGSVKYQQHPLALSNEEGLYHSLDTKLKVFESRLGTLTGAYGPIYAMPRELYYPLREDLISDFMMPLLLGKRGYRTVHEPRAVTIECGTRSLGAEFRRKRRIVQRSLHGLTVHSELLNPFRFGWLAVQLWSHKVLRWLTPFWLAGILLSTGILRQAAVFKSLFFLLLFGILAGLVGMALRRRSRSPGIFRFPSYTLMILAAVLGGIGDWARGKYHTTWEPQR